MAATREGKKLENSDIRAQKASHPSYEFAVNDGVRLSECVLLLMSGFFFSFCQKQIKAPMLSVTLPRAPSSCIAASG